MVLESLFGGLFGGLLRLAPEVLKFLDQKNARAHELAVLDKEYRVAELRLEGTVRAAEGAADMAQLSAIGEALKGQAEMAKAGGKWVSAISALVRPIVTYWFVFLYSAHKIALMVQARYDGQTWGQIYNTSWSEQDWSIFSMILVFWFVGRVHERSAGPLPRR
jgi:hypothetical protein